MSFRKSIVYDAELKYWVGVQKGQSYDIRKRCVFSLGWLPFKWWCHDKNSLWGRCFSSTSFTPNLFLLGWLKLNLDLLLVLFDKLILAQGDEGGWSLWLVLMIILFFGFLRPHLSPWGYGNRCFLVALYHLMVRRSSLEVATKKLLHQQVKILG